MTNLTQAERRAQGLAALTTLLGSQEEAETAAEEMQTDFGALGAYLIDWAFGDIWSRTGLAAKERELVVLSQLTTLGQLDQLRSHLGIALRLGLTTTEIGEVFVQLGGYAGFPRALSGMRIARDVFEQQGLSDAPITLEATPKDDAQRRADAREVLGRLNEDQPGGGPETGMGAFTGAAGRWAFGELWARDEALTRRQRSLVVVATLAAQGKSDELRFHLRGALNHGATITELEEVMITTILYVGFPTGVEGFRVLRQVQAGEPAG
ncbi:MAG: 4-carboxymuconolactone decarboxylase [Chloroflexi bacterium]|nr:MAG: 4-carboxymuconolactone decarboxylase [Chloroflexota bacterium]